jgi:WD40 repeat protein/signal recognition particle GTPase
MPNISKTFRIFISSTFSDLKDERNALQKKVFPRLKELCLQHGCRFQAIDLRWGVSEEASLDHQTIKICLDEIKRCQKVTQRPNFIILLGDRYGWQPLPAKIEAKEFQKLLKQMSNEEQARLNQWYKQDQNAVPSEYCLIPRKGKYEDKKEWEKEESDLRSILQKAAKSIFPPDDPGMIKYEASSTHQEIIQGLKTPQASEHVYCFFRKITNLKQLISDLPDNEKAKEFVDVDTDGHLYQEAFTNQEHLKNKELRSNLSTNIYDYEVKWKGNGITTAHLKKLCKDVYDSLANIILQEIQRLEEIDPLEEEIDHHQTFVRERVKFFIGRVDILNVIREYTKGTNRYPLVVSGVSGIGKSAVMAKAVEKIRKEQPAAKVIIRFIGATADSSNERTLMESLCQQIYDLFDFERLKLAQLSKISGNDENASIESKRKKIEDEFSIPYDIQKLSEKFQNFLGKIPKRKRLIILLDALDQLSDAPESKKISCLLSELPRNVSIIVSTLPNEYLFTLKDTLPEANFMQLTPMPTREGEKLLNLWLKNIGRTLQKDQIEEVLSKFNQDENGRPLYLKLAFEEACRWRSYDENIEISPGIPGIIRDRFKRLSLDVNHGNIMLSHALGYLAAAKSGLTEDELLDILSLDEEVLEDFRRRTYHRPPDKRIPVIVWSRLYFDLESYFSERTGDGVKLLSFYHRQLLESAVEEFLSGEEKQKRHDILSRYFENQPLYFEEGDSRTANLRKLSELPYQQTYGCLWDSLYRTLTDFEYLEAKCSHKVFRFSEIKNSSLKIYGGVYELLKDYRRSLDHFPTTSEIGEKKSVIEAFHRALDQAAFILKWTPDQIFSQMYNRLQWQARHLKLLKEKLAFERARFKRPWLRLLNLPTIQPPALIRTFTGHTDTVFSCAFTPDGQCIVSAGNEYAFSGVKQTIKLWNIRSGEILDSLENRTIGVNACTISPDGKRFASNSGCSNLHLEIFDLETGDQFTKFPQTFKDGRLIISIPGIHHIKLLDTETGIALVNIGEYRHSMFSCAFDLDRKKIVYPSSDETLTIKDTRTGKERLLLTDHTGSVLACTFSPDGKKILSAGEDRILKLWYTETGRKLFSLKGHNDPVLACAFSPDGKKIVSASKDNTLKLWDVDTQSELATLYGHIEAVNACAFSLDGKRIVSASTDKTLMLWDAEVAVQCNVPRGHGDEVNSCSFSPDGTRAVSSSKDNTIKLWDAQTGKEIHTLKNPTNSFIACAFSPDGRRIVSAIDDNKLQIWDVESKKKMGIVKGHTRKVETCILSPDFRCVVFVGSGKTLKILDPETKKVIADFKGSIGWVDKCPMSPDRKYIVSYHLEQLILRDLESGNKIASFFPNTKTDMILDCAISPDGKKIISGTADFRSNLKLWDVETGEEIGTLKGHRHIITSCTFSPNGKQIISASYDTILKLWDVEKQEEIAALDGAAISSCFSTSHSLRMVS